jgi:hypothetical protein
MPLISFDQDDSPRFYASDPDPDLGNVQPDAGSHTFAHQQNWVGVVDDEAGGIIAWAFSEAHAERILTALRTVNEI